MNPLIWWIDDDFLKSNSNNFKLYKKLSKYSEIRTRNITPNEFLKLLKKSLPGPDLFLIDYKLNQNPDPSNNNKRFEFTGTGLVGFIRDKYPEHPIYLVSKLIETDEGENDHFDRLMNYHWFNEKGQYTAKNVLEKDAIDYRSIRLVRNRNSIEPIYRLLDANKSSQKDISKILPRGLLGGIGDKPNEGDFENLTTKLSGVIELARWTRYEFMKYAGLLYNDLYAATYFGMTLNYFISNYSTKISKNNLCYNGIFSATNSRLWWKNSLLEHLYSLPKAKNTTLEQPWINGPYILDIPNKHRSRCIVCKDYFPETVGYDIDDAYPVHWRCSEKDETSQLPSIYEQIRIIKD